MWANQDYQLFQLIKLSQDNGAKCLDGSPNSIYYRKGSGENKNKFMFFFEGGGWCGTDSQEQTLDSCYSRSQTDLGSTKNRAQQKNITGFYTGNKEQNPIFHNYNAIQVNYCDGTGHQGHSEELYMYQNSELWFRGEANTNEAFSYAMENLSMKNADQIIIGGYSAGGLACFTWADELKQRIQEQNPNTEVFAFCDSGVFMDFENMETKTMSYRNRIQNFMAYSNKETSVVNRKCAQAYPNEQWKCMLAEYLLEFVEVKTLIANSEYDSYCLHQIAGISQVCLDKDEFTDNCTQEEQDQLDNYRDHYLATILNIVENKNNLGLWTPACVKHCFNGSTFQSDDWALPAGSKWTLGNSLQQFISEKGVQIRYDADYYPSNFPCSRQYKGWKQILETFIIYIKVRFGFEPTW